METIIICTIFGAFIIISYTFGLKNGQKLSNNKNIDMPFINIPKKIKEYQESKDIKQEQQQLGALLRNIERYDGSGIGQEDIE